MPIARTLRDVLCAGALIAALGAAAACAGLSHPADHAGGAVPARWQHHHRRAHRRRQDERGARPVDRHRQSRRRRWHGRKPRGGEERSRRLHHILGYTGTLAIGPTLYGNAGYDPRADFAPIGRIGTAPNTLVVHPSLSVHSVAELIAYAKANPGKLNYGSAGIGTVSHVCGEYFATAAGVKITHSLQGDRTGDHRPARRAHSRGVRADAGSTRMPGPASCACWR